MNPPLLDDTTGAVIDGFVRVRIADVIQETPDAVSLVLDVPAAYLPQFGYQAGQYLPVQVDIDGQQYRRCYSMSSSPAADEQLRITVKRDRDGVVSNWLNDRAARGVHIHASPPEGKFVRGGTDRELVAFAGGSGITPVFSLLHTMFADGGGRARLFYANRSADSVIFAAALSEMAERHRDALVLRHHLDERDGLVSAPQISEFLSGAGDAEYFVCGPGPFMDTVECALQAAGVPNELIHLERFTVASLPSVDPGASVTEQVTIELDRRSTTVDYRSGNTLLQTARLAGLKAPSSCETGSCGTCMAQVVEGSARMLNNDALDEDEVADGWVVTCQALPTSTRVRVVYE